MPRILVIDDEAQIVLLACTALRRAGFDALGANSVSQALESWDEEIDLLLTDCVMPETSGDEVAAILRERKPELAVVFMSGNVISSVEVGVPLEEGVNFLQKPFEFQGLVSIVKNALSTIRSGEAAGRTHKGAC